MVLYSISGDNAFFFFSSIVPMRLYNECPQESEFRQEFMDQLQDKEKIGSCRVKVFAQLQKNSILFPL